MKASRTPKLGTGSIARELTLLSGGRARPRDPRPRGRRPSTKPAIDIDIIGRAAERMIAWGISRPDACRELGKAAAKSLGRVGPDGAALTAKRVEQFLDAWRAQAIRQWREPRPCVTEILDGVHEAIKAAARAAAALDPAREDVKVHWMPSTREHLERAGFRWVRPPFDRSSYTTASLAANAPFPGYTPKRRNATIARILLRHAGSWPREKDEQPTRERDWETGLGRSWVGPGDRELTPRARAQSAGILWFGKPPNQIDSG